MSARNMEAFFSPKSIALIGASRRPRAVGSVIARNLLLAGFDGVIMPVNPHEQAIQGVFAYPDIPSLPVPPDLAVIATPAESVPGIVQALGARGCRAAVVISAGFESVQDGSSLRDQLIRAADETGMRLIGPNCLGIMAPNSNVNASFGHIPPLKGRIACVMQSGALVASVLEWANGRGIGFSKMISLGDAVDVDFGDVLTYLADDPETEAVCLYVEGLTHARKFMAAARHLARTKPIIVMKAGRNPAAAQAVKSHTGALAGSDRVYDAALRRAGIVRVSTLDQMFDAVEILGRPHVKSGKRLAIVTNGGGGGILATDAMLGSDLELAQLSPAIVATLNEFLPTCWSHGNPTDIIGDADGARYAQTLTVMASDPSVEAIVIVNCPTAISSSHEAAVAVVEARSRLKGSAAEKPIVACWMGGSADSPAFAALSQAGIPTFQTPEQAIRALKFLRDFTLRRSSLTDRVPAAPVTRTDVKLASHLLQKALQDGREWLDESDSKALLKAYGIPVVETVRAESPDAVADAARMLGEPVAVKILSRDIQHKSDVGGVALSLETPEKAREAAVKMLERIAKQRPDAKLDGFTVSTMVVRRNGREVIAGLATDPTFGPVVLFGQGGIAAEQIDDVAVALPPLTMAVAADLIKETRVSRLLKSFRDWPQADLAAIQKVLVALGHMALEHPEITELDINPLIADESGAVALDARVRVKDPTAAVPAALECHADDQEEVIRDAQGRDVFIRPIHPDDAPALQRFIAQLDPTTIRARFFETLRRLPADLLARLTQIDSERELAFVAVERRKNGEADPQDDRICGVARIIILPDGKKAEYALTASPDAIERGIARALMSKVISSARARGIERLCGEELNDSLEHIQLARDLGGAISHDPDDPAVACITLALDSAVAPA